MTRETAFHRISLMIEKDMIFIKTALLKLTLKLTLLLEESIVTITTSERCYSSATVLDATSEDEELQNLLSEFSKFTQLRHHTFAALILI